MRRALKLKQIYVCVHIYKCRLLKKCQILVNSPSAALVTLSDRVEVLCCCEVLSWAYKVSQVLWISENSLHTPRFGI